MIFILTNCLFSFFTPPAPTSASHNIHVSIAQVHSEVLLCFYLTNYRSRLARLFYQLQLYRSQPRPPAALRSNELKRKGDQLLTLVAEHQLGPGPMQTHLSVNHLCSADRMANYIELNQYTRNKSEQCCHPLIPDLQRNSVTLFNLYLLIRDNVIRI